jgi:hypothetical protein
VDFSTVDFSTVDFSTVDFRNPLSIYSFGPWNHQSIYFDLQLIFRWKINAKQLKMKVRGVKALMKNNRGVELNNSGSLKSPVELGVSTVEYENPLWKNQLWNSKIHCGIGRVNCGHLWTSRSLFHSSTNNSTVELWKNIS